MAQITTPVAGFTGKVVGVDFVDGKGETDDESAIAYFDRQGYGIDGADPDDADEPDYIDDRPGGFVGVEFDGPDSGPFRDAADPRNEMIPVGGVKSDGTVVAGRGRGKRVSAVEQSGTTPGGDEAAGAAPSPSQPVQETGDPKEASASPSGTNPSDATTKQGKTPADQSTPDSGSQSKEG